MALAVRGQLRVRYPVPWLSRRRSLVEERLRAIDGVRTVSVSTATGSVRIAYDPRRATEAEILASLPSAHTVADSAPGGDAISLGARGWLPLTAATAVLAATWLPLPPPLKLGLAAASALPALGRAASAAGAGRRLSGDMLEAVTLGLLLLRRQPGAAALLAWFRALGDWIVRRATTRVRRSLQQTLAPAGRTVRRLGDGHATPVPIGALAVGDQIVLGAGEEVPADGTVLSGEALVDQQTMTGEGLPVERGPDDHVFAATTVEDGEITVRVDRVGRDTAFGRIVTTIEAAAVAKSDVQRFAESLADEQVLRTLVLAGLGATAARSLDAGVAVMVADYGMVARVGIPTAFLAALARASRMGIVVKGAAALEGLARVDTVVFDKTGTLTSGTPHATGVFTYGALGVDEVVRLAAAAERGFRHPVARAISRLGADRGLTLLRRSSPAPSSGLGVDVDVEGTRVLVGSRRFMVSRGIALDAPADDEAAAHAEGGSLIYVAADGRLVGALVLRDELRDDARETVAALRARGVRNLVVVTGDHPEPTRVIADSLGLREYHSEAMPEDKAALVRALRADGRIVAMVGDGVNDALALNEADVGIAVRGGPAVVVEAADVVLVRGGLTGVADALDLARSAIDGTRRAITVAKRANLGVLGLASLGLAPPIASIVLSRGAAIGSAASRVAVLAQPTSEAARSLQPLSQSRPRRLQKR